MKYNIENFDEALLVMKQAGEETVVGPESNHPHLANELADELVSQMSLKEKVGMLSGHWLPLRELLHGRTYNYMPIPGCGCKRLGIPAILFSDGPRGVVMKNSTAFPTPNIRAAAFDDGLEARIGDAIAEECISRGANFFAGVCLNLLRHPAWGRAQEAYGEDQYLTGRYGEALVRALQKRGVIACPKHFALNSIENLRFSVNARADRETMNDVYLWHFRKCAEAGAGSFMSAYNQVNGSFCGENKELLSDCLRGRLGFNGFTISDFIWGVHDGTASLEAGLDVEMPMTLYRGRKLKKAVRKGKLQEDKLDEACRRIIATLLRFQNCYRAQSVPDEEENAASHAALSREALEKGCVLLKNDGMLPIENRDAKIALVGRFANDRVIGDHGSSCVYPPYIVTPAEGLKKVYTNLSVASTNEIDKCSKAAADADYIIAVLGNNFEDEGEFMMKGGEKVVKGGDRSSLRLHPADVELIHAMAAFGKPLLVVFYSGSAVLTSEWDQEAGAILYAGYPGMEGGNALAALISGAVNPSGKLPFTVAAREEDYPPFLYREDGRQDIDYGYYHGYALMEKRHLSPAYPFGFGLSYTSFAYGEPEVKDEGESLLVTVPVTNTGVREGCETVLVFVGSNIEFKPHKLLKGFCRVDLAPGETRQAEIRIAKEDLVLFNPLNEKMEVSDALSVFVGANAADAEKRCVNL